MITSDICAYKREIIIIIIIIIIRWIG